MTSMMPLMCLPFCSWFVITHTADQGGGATPGASREAHIDIRPPTRVGSQTNHAPRAYQVGWVPPVEMGMLCTCPSLLSHRRAVPLRRPLHTAPKKCRSVGMLMMLPHRQQRPVVRRMPRSFMYAACAWLLAFCSGAPMSLILLGSCAEPLGSKP